MARSRRVLLVGALVIGVAGCAVLAGLGTWQVQRHFWKQDLLAAMEARLLGTPAALPDAPDPARDTFAPVQVTGAYTGDEVLVMAARRGSGAGTERAAACAKSTQGWACCGAGSRRPTAADSAGRLLAALR